MAEKMYSGEGLTGTLTRFGTLSSSLPESVAYLRSVGYSNGVRLLDFTEADAAAAIVGADTWMMVVGGSGIDIANPYASVRDSKTILSNIILRACGHGAHRPYPNYSGSDILASNTIDFLLKEQENQELWLNNILKIEDKTILQEIFYKIFCDYSYADPSNPLSLYSEIINHKYSILN